MGNKSGCDREKQTFVVAFLSDFVNTR